MKGLGKVAKRKRRNYKQPGDFFDLLTAIAAALVGGVKSIVRKVRS